MRGGFDLDHNDRRGKETDSGTASAGGSTDAGEGESTEMCIRDRYQNFKRRYTDLPIAELLKAVWNFDPCICPACGHAAMKQLGRSYVPSS